MSVAETIRAKLTAALAPQVLDVVDESHRHAGHAGSRPEGETHFRVTIVAAAFEPMARLERHRCINTILATELAGPVHALVLRTLTPAEAAAGRS